MARQKENTERINVFFSPEAIAQLKDEAKEKGMSISGVVRYIVLLYLNNKNPMM